MDNITTVLRYNADFSSAIAQARALAAQVGVLSTSFNYLDKAAAQARNTMATTFATQVAGIGGFSTKMVDITSQTERFGKALANNKLTMREYFAEAYRGYTRQDSMMRKLARQQVRFQESIVTPVGKDPSGRMKAMVTTPAMVDFKNASTRMKLLGQEFAIFNQLVRNGAEELINMGKNTQWTGRQLTVGLTMPVVLFGAMFAKTFMDIDKEMTRFAKVYGQDVVGTVTDETNRMKDAVMGLASEISSKYGVAAKETVALAADIAATGKEGQDLLATVEQTNKLAVLGEVDRQEAMKATLAIQTAFKQNTEELADSINFLNAVENQTSTTLNDLVEAIPKAGPVVKGLGGSIEDLSVLMVAMKEGGIPAAEAANAIKSGLASLINPTKKASEVAKQFGVDLVGIVDANKGQLMPTIMAVQDALSGLDSFSRSKVIEEIFGKYQFARISALFNNLGKAGSQTQQAMELAGASTTDLAAIANQELSAYTESTTVRFQRMVETIKNQLIPLAGSLLESIIPVLDKVSSIIDFLKQGFERIPGFIKEPMKIMGALALVAGPVLMLVGLFKNLIGNAIKFGMSIIGFGAKLRGIDTAKFELLNEESAAAKIKIDDLSNSFNKQKTAIQQLNVELTRYLEKLKGTAIANPGLVSGGPRPMVPPPMRRRAMGSDSPERVPGGYGGGDSIPALLEPGEMVIRKEAVSKYEPILKAMNRGTLPGFSNGTDTRLGGEEKAIVVSPEERVYFRKQEKSGQWAAHAGKMKGFEPLGYPGQDREEAKSELVRAHVTETGGAYKNISFSRPSGRGMIAPAWTDPMYIPGTQAQNLFENTASKSTVAQESFEQSLRSVSKNAAQIDRMMTNLRLGVMQDARDLETYARALDHFSKSPSLPQRARDRDVVLTAARQAGEAVALAAKHANNPAAIAAGYQIVGATPQQKTAALTEMTKGYGRMGASIAEIERKHPGGRGLNAGQRETLALLKSTQAELGVRIANLRTSIEAMGAKGAKQAADAIILGLSDFDEEFGIELRKQLGISSPAKAAAAIAESAAVETARGVLIGLEKGLKQLDQRRGQLMAEKSQLGQERGVYRDIVARSSAEQKRLAMLPSAPGLSRAAVQSRMAELEQQRLGALRQLASFDQLEIEIERELKAINQAEQQLKQQHNQTQQEINALKQREEEALQRSIASRATPIAGVERGLSEIAVKRAAAEASLEKVKAEIPRLEALLASARARLVNMGPGFAASPLGAAVRKEIETLEKQILTLKQQEVRDEKYIQSMNAGEKKLAQKKLELERQIIQLTEAERRQAAQAASMPNQIGASGVGGGRLSPDGGASRGMGGAMNAMFGLSMVTSMMTMFGDSTSAATSALSQFSMALMGISSLMMFMPSGGGFFGKRPIDPATGLKRERNLLGLTGLGEGMLARSGKYQVDAKTGGVFRDRAGKLLPAMGGAGAGGSNKLAMLGEFAFAIGTKGGPYVAAAVIAIAAVTAAIIQYNRAAEEARKRTVAAFSDPLKTAEALGSKIRTAADLQKELNQQYRTRMAGSEDPIDPTLLEAVRQDYAMLIEKLKYQSAESGAQELAQAYNKMLSAGLSAEKAKEAVRAIAAEAGSAGGAAFSQAITKGMMNAETVQEAIQGTVDSLNPAKNLDLKRSLMAQQTEAEKIGSGMFTEALQPTNFIPLVGPAVTFFRNIGENVAEKGFFSGFAETMLQSNPLLNTIGTALANANWLPDAAGILVSDEVEALQEQAQRIDQFKKDVEEMSDVSTTQLTAMSEQMTQAFDKAPMEAKKAFRQVAQFAQEYTAVAFDIKPIEDYFNSIDAVTGPVLTQYIQLGQDEADQQRRASVFMHAVTVGVPQDVLVGLIKKHGQNTQALEREMKLLTRHYGLLERAANILERRQQSVATFAEGALTDALKKGQEALEDLLEAQEAYIKMREDKKDDLQDSFEDQQELIDDEIESLQDEKEQIERTTDAYIKSIDKRKKADSFYLQQRKSSLSALSKLAQGDIFGFIMERQEKAGRAAEYSYDREIEKIQERKDAELQSIDDVIKAKQKEKEINEENHKELMDNYDEMTEKGKQAFAERINDQRTHNAEMQTIIDSLNEGEIETVKKVTQAFGIELGKRYEEKQKDVARAMVLEARQRIFAGLSDPTTEYEQLSKFFRQVYGKAEFERLFGARSGLIEGAQAANVTLSRGADMLAAIGMDPLSERAKPFRGVVSDTPGQFAGYPLLVNGKAVSTSNPMPVVMPGPWQRLPNGGASGFNYMPLPGTKKFDTVSGKTYAWNPTLGWMEAAMGGLIRGPGSKTSDSIPAMLSNGEYVIRASSVDKYGTGFMDALNSGQIGFPGFAMGGMPKMKKLYLAGGGFAANSMMSYRDGGMAPTSIRIDSRDRYNIYINGVSTEDARDIADMVMKKIHQEKMRMNHERYIKG